MNALEKRVAGDWFDIREASNSFISLNDYFKISQAEMLENIEKLKFSVEQGIVEYKRTLLSPLFTRLEDSKYQSLEPREMEDQIRITHSLLFIVLIQGLFVEGTLRFSRNRVTNEEAFSPDDFDLKSIIKDIQDRIKKKPETGKRPAVKMILLQIGMYRKERDTLKKLLPAIKPGNKKSMILNSKKRFAEITDKIKRYYIEMVKEENPDGDENRNILELVPLKDTLDLLKEQSRIISGVKSTLSFVKEEKYKTREILVKLYAERATIARLFDREIEAYGDMAAKLDSSKIKGRDRDIPYLLSRMFCNEIILLLEREVSFKRTAGG